MNCLEYLNVCFNNRFYYPSISSMSELNKIVDIKLKNKIMFRKDKSICTSNDYKKVLLIVVNNTDLITANGYHF